MWNNNLVDEVRGLILSGLNRQSKAFDAIGYRHALEYLDGKISREEAIMLMQRDTRRYAKRQITWFKKQHSLQWFEGFGNDEGVRKRVHHFVRDVLSVRFGSSLIAKSRV